MTATIPTPLDVRQHIKNPVRLTHALSDKERARARWAPFFAEGVGVQVAPTTVVQRIEEINGVSRERAVDLLHEGVKSGAVILSAQYELSLA